MRIQIGTWLQPKNENNRDGVFSRVDNIVFKNRFLYRIHCTNICAGFELGEIKIKARDIKNWEVIKVKELITTKVKDFNEMVNDLTREMDEHLLQDKKFPFCYTYLLPDLKGERFILRYPGATRGQLYVDKNNIITEILLNENRSCYKDTVKDIIQKYIGIKIVIID